MNATQSRQVLTHLRNALKAAQKHNQDNEKIKHSFKGKKLSAHNEAVIGERMIQAVLGQFTHVETMNTRVR